MMRGTFYIVGVGPGDAELLTLKAVRIIKECNTIAIPVARAGFEDTVSEPAGESCAFPEVLGKCTAYQIVLPAVPEIAQKAKIYLPMPMMKRKDILKAIHDKGAEEVAKWLDMGENVAFLTLGDPSVYSTGMYVQKRLDEQGYHTEMIAGIPSFCAVAARLNTALAKNKEEIHIIPASYGVEESLNLPGTKILMKAGKKIPEIKEAVKKRGLQIQMVENCGMEGERIYSSVEEIPDESSYYSLIMIKEEA